MKVSILSVFFSLLITLTLPFSANTATPDLSAFSGASKSSYKAITEKYYALPTDAQDLSFKAFDLAYKAYMKTPLYKNNVLTIVDFTKPSNQKRFYVIDVKQNTLLYKTYTSHGKNTGYKYAENFSNISESKQSSLGFFKTGATYYGKHGYSLRLHGLENGINDKAFDRAIVIHSADYLSENYIKQHGRAGRSWGCPALPNHLSKDIIDSIKNGSGLFIYAQDNNYQKKSKLCQNS